MTHHSVPVRAIGATALVAALVLAPVAAVGAGVSGVGLASAQTPNPCVGTVEQQPDRATVVSIQGAHQGEKTDAMLVSVAPSGEVIGVHNDDDYGRWWAYDVDRLPNGNFLMATTQNRHTVVEEIDDETGEHVVNRSFTGLHDTHDVDLINGDELLMNDMGDEHNRVVVYNLTTESITWEYRFDEHTDEFPIESGGEYGEDWTHNNDVEQIREGVIMVSLKNFNQVVAINRSTKEVLWELGEEGNTSILNKQHNPDFLRTEDGRATVIVADSRNDRVAEYTREGDEWNLTWSLTGGGLDEPRDADRLPNGNTLVVDRHGHRMVEVTPSGEVLWEVYLPYQPYDVERLGTPDESAGPTMADLPASGRTTMDGEPVAESDLAACYGFLTNATSSRLVPEGDPGVVTEDPTMNTPDTATDSGGDGSEGDTTGGDENGNEGDGSMLGTTTSGSGPGLGVGGAVLAVVALVVALLVRRD
jgi:hypothetical protein